MFCRSVLLPTRKKRNSTILAQSLMLSRKSHCDNFTCTNSSSKTQIVRRIDFQRQFKDKIAQRKLDWQEQHFFFKPNTWFSSVEHFYPNDWKIFSFQLNEIDEKLLKTKGSVVRLNSLQQKINESKTKIELKTAAKQNNIWKTKFAKLTENFTILKEKIHRIPSQITRRNAQFNDRIQPNWIGDSNRSENGRKKRQLKSKICKLLWPELLLFVQWSPLKIISSDRELNLALSRTGVRMYGQIRTKVRY